MKTLYWIVLLLLSISFDSFAQKKKEKGINPPSVLMTIGKQSVDLEEFEYLYKKNFTNGEIPYSEQRLNEYLQLFIAFKLKVQEAYSLKIDQLPSFQREFQAYQKQLARPYLTDREYSDKILQETYSRMQEEVNVSHILILISENAPAKDTLVAYQKVMALYNRLLKGNEDFNQVAFEVSEDPSAKTNKGNLGFFTAMQMVYPFETAAYNTPVGSVSKPIRTKFGYHLVKVHQKRPFSGFVTVAHIMIRANEGMNPEDITEAERKIKEIKEQLTMGADWNTLCRQFSEDFFTKDKGGLMQEFTVGQLPESFSEAAFQLEDKGKISEVVRTPFGFHLMKLVDRKPLKIFDLMLPELKERISKDERSEVPQKFFIEKLKKANSFKENLKNKEYALKQLTKDSSLLKGTFETVMVKESMPLFTLNNKIYQTSDFLLEVENKQTARPDNTSLPEFANLLYQNYVHKIVLENEEAQLENKYPAYKNSLKEYKEGLMLFQIMEDSVWNFATKNEEGLKNFFEQNRANYQWKERAEATIYNCAHDSIFKAVKNWLDVGKFPLNKNSYPTKLIFPFNQKELSADMQKSFDTLISVIILNPDFSLHLQATHLPKEKSTVSDERLKALKGYLMNQGVMENQLVLSKVEKFEGKINKKDKNGGWISCSLWGNSLNILENEFNAQNPLALQVISGKFEKGDNALIDKVSWEKGRYEMANDNRQQLVVIHQILPTQNKEMMEAKGMLVSDYQTFLEKSWVERLKNKYPVVVKEEVLKSLVK
jgi:peptidyl-prolyl cis-trans isomerase SurA